MLATCLAEYEIGNPWLFEPLLPSVAMRMRHVYEAAMDMPQHAPKGRGTLPTWMLTARKISRISGSINEVLAGTGLSQQIKEHRWAEVTRGAKSMIQASQYIRDILTKVPLEHSRIVMTINGFREVELLNIERKS